MKKKNNNKDKLYVVYKVSHNNLIYYIGHGAYGRQKHVNSGCSHVYELNRMHFNGVVFSIDIEKFNTKQDASAREEFLIRALKPPLNKVFTDSSKINKMKSLSLLKKFVLDKSMMFVEKKDISSADHDRLRRLVNEHSIYSCIVGCAIKFTNKSVYQRIRALINSCRNPKIQDKKKNFLNYFYMPLYTTEGVSFLFAEGVVEDFRKYIEKEYPELIKEFNGMMIERQSFLSTEVDKEAA